MTFASTAHVRFDRPTHVRRSRIAAACSLLLAGIAPSMAQTSPAPPAAAASAPEQSQTIVVTGIRRSLETSLELKRGSRGLVDGIVAEDIGKFPDTNLAESMQRISGVSIDRSPSGEGSKITVRGIGPDFNLILLNGRQMPTGIISNENGGANGSRAFDFANLSSDAISALEVYKTSNAASPTGGIGATINVRTARPLDTKVRIAAFGAKANFDASNSRLPDAFKGSSATPELSGIYSDVFADGTIGIAISGSYAKRDSGSNKAYTQNGWRTFPANSGDWGSIPPVPTTGPDPITNRPTGLYGTSVDMRYSVTALERERLNGQAVLQYAPSKDLKFTLDYTLANNTINKKNAELSSWFNFSFGPTTFTTGGPVVSPLIQTALFPALDHDLAINGGLYGEKTQLRSTGFNTEWKVSNSLKLEFDGHHSNSVTKPNSPFGTYSVLDFGLLTQGNAIAYYDKKLPILSLPTTQFNAAKLLMLGSQFVNNLSDQTVDQWQTRGTYKLDADNKLQAGLGFTKIKNRAAGYTNQNNDWSGVGVQGDYANVSVRTENLGSFFSQIPGHDDPRLFQNFYMHDFNSLRARAIDVIMASRGLTRAQAEAYFSASPDYTRGNDWRTTEKTSSLYGQWDHAFDAAGIPMNVSVGLRYETTKIDSSSQVVTRSATSWDSQNEVNLAAGAPTFGSANGKYSYVLPNIDWDADLTTDLKLRASVGKTLGRPNWDALLGGINVNGTANAGGGAGSTGNPALKPQISTNFDMALEYYYAKSSYLAAGAFHKSIKNFVGSTIVKTTIPGITTPIGGAYYLAGQAACVGQANQPQCIRNWIFRNRGGQPGVTITDPDFGTPAFLTKSEVQGRIAGLPTDPLLSFDITTPSNEKGDKVKGLELNAQHMIGKTGFGIAGNYTWVRTGLKFDNASLATQSALVGVSNSANLVGFYEDATWSVRGAYNWRGEFLAAKTDGAGNNPVYTEPYGQFDMSIGYKVGKDLTIQADLINLNDGYIRQHGRTKEELQSVTQTGRRYQIGARYRF
jgi:TonB-dependent receptor